MVERQGVTSYIMADGDLGIALFDPTMALDVRFIAKPKHKSLVDQ